MTNSPVSLHHVCDHPSECVLPLELCEHVVGFVDSWWGWGCMTTSLHSCTLVCRGWLPKSRIQLYRRVVLRNKRQATSFMATISTTPQLGNYVRTLEILPGDHSDWIYRIHWVLPPLLPRLIRLTYAGLPVLRPVFFVLPSQFKTVTSLFLWILENQSFREVVWILNQFPNLQKLEVLECASGPFYCRDQKKPECAPSVHLSVKYSKSSAGRNESLFVWLKKKQHSTPIRTLIAPTDDGISRPTSSLIHDLMRMHTVTLHRLEVRFTWGGSAGDSATCQ